MLYRVVSVSDTVLLGEGSSWMLDLRLGSSSSPLTKHVARRKTSGITQALQRPHGRATAREAGAAVSSRSASPAGGGRRHTSQRLSLSPRHRCPPRSPLPRRQRHIRALHRRPRARLGGARSLRRLLQLLRVAHVLLRLCAASEVAARATEREAARLCFLGFFPRRRASPSSSASWTTEWERSLSRIANSPSTPSRRKC